MGWKWKDNKHVDMKTVLRKVISSDTHINHIYALIRSLQKKKIMAGWMNTWMEKDKGGWIYMDGNEWINEYMYGKRSMDMHGNFWQIRKEWDRKRYFRLKMEK